MALSLNLRSYLDLLLLPYTVALLHNAIYLSIFKNIPLFLCRLSLYVYEIILLLLEFGKDTVYQILTQFQ